MRIGESVKHGEGWRAPRNDVSPQRLLAHPRRTVTRPLVVRSAQAAHIVRSPPGAGGPTAACSFSTVVQFRAVTRRWRADRLSQARACTSWRLKRPRVARTIHMEG
jgi:hypothetical protein